MCTILDKIVERKKEEIAEAKAKISIENLKLLASQRINRNSFKEALTQKDSSGIIAEFKRQSPSKGVINGNVTPCEVSTGYTQAGVAGISVLTDHDFFGGSLADLKEVRANNPTTPVLRKEFIIDEYQIVEAAAHGADAILLIAEILTAERTHQLAQCAKEYHLEILFEVHSEEELTKVSPLLDMIGVNNRDLRTFDVDPNRSLELLSKIDSQFVPVSESGISSTETVIKLKKAGFKGFLMGENFMKELNPGLACQQFIEIIKA